MHYQFSVSKEGIKRVLADMFTSEITFLKELAQNAQRAGATQLEIDYLKNNNVLLITDNGQGFTEEGWQSFFIVGESGWGETIKEEQNPFGIGCAACLYAADDICIQSGNYQVHFNTAGLLAGTPVERTENRTYTQGAVLGLKLKTNLNIAWILNEIPKEFSAFPIPVMVNGVAIDRPLALDAARKFIETDIGQLMLTDQEVPQSQGFNIPRSGSVGYILQGFMLQWPIKIDAWIHLDSKKFRARVPDRTCLVGNTDELDKRIKQLFREAVRQQLEEALRAEGNDSFAYNYWFEALQYAPDLIAQSAVPDYLFRSPKDIPYEQFWGYCSPNGNSKTDGYLYSTSDLQGKHIFNVLDILGIAGEEVEVDEHILIGNYAYLHGGLYINAASLPENHWLRKQVIATDYYDYDNDVGVGLEGMVTPLGTVHRFQVSTAGYSNQTVVLCDSFQYCVKGLTTLNSQPLEVSTVESKTIAVWCDGIIYIPACCNSVYSVVRQTVNVGKRDFDDFELDQSYLDEVIDMLWSVIRVQRGVDVTEVLSEIINEHRHQLNAFIDKLVDKQFTLIFEKPDNRDVMVTINEPLATR